MNELNTVRVDLHTKSGREIVERLIRGAGAPGSLAGFMKNGSAVLLFRSLKPHATVPLIQGASHLQRVFQLSTLDGTVRLTISTESETAPDVKWDRETDHNLLPATTLTAGDVGERIINAAFGLGLMWSSIVDFDLANAERLAQQKADLASGKLKIPTDEERDAERDARIVADAEGRDVEWTDGPAAQLILNARARVAAWRAKSKAQAAA